MGTNLTNEILWFIQNFEEIWRDKLERSSIFSLDYKAFSSILSSDNLNVKNEYIVWNALHDWVNFDKDNRQEYLPCLIYDCLRFGLLDEHFIDVSIFECDIFMNLNDQLTFKMFIKDILQSRSSIITENLTGLSSCNDISFRPRNAPLLVCIEHNYGTLEYYDSQYDLWHYSEMSLKVPNDHRGYQLAQLGIDGSELYALGAYGDHLNAANSVWSRSLSDPSEWRAMANMNQLRMGFCHVVLNNIIYVMGGEDENYQYLSSCGRYSSQLNQWSIVADMNTERSLASAAVHNGCIYIAGGWSEGRVAQSVEKYDPQSNEWSQVAPMSTARSYFALTSFVGRLWAIGGRGVERRPMSLVESYDPVTDSWREEAPLSEARYGHAAIEFNGKLYVAGGSTLKMPLKTVEAYTPSQGWIKAATMHSDMSDPLSNMNLYFGSKEEAIEYCKRHGLTYQVDEPQERKKLHKLYADNFSWSKQTRVGSK